MRRIHVTALVKYVNKYQQIKHKDKNAAVFLL